MINQNLSTQITKATTATVVHTYTNRKSHTPHYAITFTGIPFMTKDLIKLYGELIFHDCTFNDPIPNKKKWIIPNFQSYIINNPFSFVYHEHKGTSELFIIYLPEGE